MAFELQNVVPWGRNLSEYTAMFRLTGADLNRHIISFGDGPASFNAEMTEQNRKVVSVDPLYVFPCDEIKQRIGETAGVVLEQARANENNFIWKNIRNVDDLGQVRIFY